MSHVLESQGGLPGGGSSASRHGSMGGGRGSSQGMGGVLRGRNLLMGLFLSAAVPV